MKSSKNAASTPKKRAVHEDIIGFLSNKKVAALVGAGISRNSGLPIVDDFYEKFFSIFYKKNDVKKIRDSIEEKGTPFEQIIENIFKYTGNDYQLMDVFSGGNPNILHRILAQMMLQNWAIELYTTNFDCLIEKAIEEAGITQKEYGRFYDEDSFSKASVSSQDRKLIKIHGTIDKEESIRATLETITSIDRLIKRKPSIDRLFSTGQHDAVIVLGYSFSDIFDISKFIKETNITKTVIIINHSMDSESCIQPLSDMENFPNKNLNPFFQKNIKGYFITTNTAAFMTQICKIEEPNIACLENVEQFNWKKCLENWASKFDATHKLYIAGGICNAMGRFDIANKYFKKAARGMLDYKEANSDKMSLYFSFTNNYILSRFRTRKNQEKCDGLALECKNSIQLLKDNEGKISSKNYMKLLTDLTYRLGRIYEDGYSDQKENAREQYIAVYKLDQINNDVLAMSQTLHQIGSIDCSLGDFKSAMRNFKRSIKLKERCGYLAGIARTYYTMAVTMYRDGKTKQAGQCLCESEKIANDIGISDLIYDIKNLYGCIFMDKKLWFNAREEFIKILNSEMQSTSSFSIILNISRCEIRLGNYRDAIEWMGKYIQRINAWGDQKRIFKFNMELALAYLLNDEYKKCCFYLFKNVDIMKVVSISEIGCYLFYVALYYRNSNFKEYYKDLLNASKQCFLGGGVVEDFHELKRDFDGRIFSKKTSFFDKNERLYDAIMKRIADMA